MAVKINMESNEKTATRDSYGRALAELGKEHEDIVVLDADLAETTKTVLFKKEFPDRHYDCGIAEGNMIGIAAGLASCGKTVFASSFAMFAAGRAFEQVRNSVAHTGANVKIAATHAGITVGEDGATHQCLEDISLMRTIPEMTVIVPSDDIETKAAVKAAYEHEGPVYIRLGRYAVPAYNDAASYKFEVGKGIVVKDGTDITMFATGLEVFETLKAAQLLEKDGISAEVINIHTIKPIDRELIIKSVSKTKKAVTVEEHSVIGGLFSAVSEVLAQNCPAHVLPIGMNDCFGQSGPAAQLLAKYGLDAEGIYNKTKEFLEN